MKVMPSLTISMMSGTRPISAKSIRAKATLLSRDLRTCTKAARNRNYSRRMERLLKLKIHMLCRMPSTNYLSSRKLSTKVSLSRKLSNKTVDMSWLSTRMVVSSVLLWMTASQFTNTTCNQYGDFLMIGHGKSS